MTIVLANNDLAMKCEGEVYADARRRNGYGQSAACPRRLKQLLARLQLVAWRSRAAIPQSISHAFDWLAWERYQSAIIADGKPSNWPHSTVTN